MSPERPEFSFKELLLVPDGPPESIWRNALNYAFTETDAGLAGPEEIPAPGDPDGIADSANEAPGPGDDDFTDPPETGGPMNAGWDDTARSADDEDGLDY